jgi:hypothetical protein
MSEIIEAAKKGGVFKWDYKTQADAIGYGTGAWQQETFLTIYTYCLKAVQEIDGNTDNVDGFVIIASPGVICALEALDQFEIDPELLKEDDGDFESGCNYEVIHRVGKVGRFQVYRDMFATEDYIVVGKIKDETTNNYADSRFIEIIGLSDAFRLG